MKILKDNALLIILNLIIALLLAAGLASKMKYVKQCSLKLFWSGILFECYFIFFLVRTVTVVSVCFCIKNPYKFYWITISIFAAIDTFLFTSLVIYSGVILFQPDVVQCRV